MSDMDKKAKETKGKRSFKKRFRYGGFAAILTIVVVAALVLVNIGVGSIESNWALKIDLSANKVTDFEEGTYEVLTGVETEVHMYTVYAPTTQNATRVKLEEITREYRSINNNITLGNIDPISEPGRISKYTPKDGKISEGTIIVTNADETRIKLVTPSDYNATTQNPLTGASIPIFSAEPRLTSAVLHVSSDSTPIVYLLQGHNEVPMEAFMYLQRELESINFEFKTLNLVEDDTELKKGDIVMVVDPIRDISADEYATLRDWLAAGGRLLTIMDVNIDMSLMKNITSLLDYYQLSYGDGYIKEADSMTGNWYQAPTILRPIMDAEHPVYTSMPQNSILLIPQARPINPITFKESGIVYNNLLTTSDIATVIVSEDEPASEPGTQIVAMTAAKMDYEDPTNDVRIAMLGSAVTMGDTDFLFMSHNMDFALNLFEWLANRQSRVSVSSKMIPDTVLRIPDAASAYTIGGIAVGGVPLIIVIAGIVIWIRRRRL